MTNEMDLHSTNHVPKSGTTRMLVYYYAILIIACVLAFLAIGSGIWEFATGIAFAVLAAIPVAIAFLKRRKLEKIRRSQLTELRKDKT